MVLIGGGAASALYADNVVVTYEPAGVEAPNTSALCAGATTCVIGTENFDLLGGTLVPFTTDYGLTGAQTIAGTYSGALYITPADEFGGAGGTGYYPEVIDNTYTITLTSGGIPGVNYFGMWFSALDPGNELQFSENSTLLYTFTPQEFVSLVGACPGTGFCGDPSGTFAGQNSNQQYAFLNFFDTNGYFNTIVFTENYGDGGFESDNHTVGYQDPSNPSGTVIGATPEPGTLLLFAAVCWG